MIADFVRRLAAWLSPDKPAESPPVLELIPECGDDHRPSVVLLKLDALDYAVRSLREGSHPSMVLPHAKLFYEWMTETETVH